MERRCRVKGVEWREGSAMRHRERVTNGDACRCFNCVCDCARVDEYVHVQYAGARVCRCVRAYSTYL